MRSLIRLAAVAALLGTSAHADWLLSDYATLTTDSASTDKAYGIQCFRNKASTAVPKVATAGSLSVAATFATEATGAYTANLGLLHPFNPDWSAADLSTLTAVKFDIKASVKMSDGWSFSFGSKVYGDELSNAGTVLLAPFAVNTPNVWTPITIDPTTLIYPDWFCDDVLKMCPPITITDVLKATENIQIAPKTKYVGKDGTAPVTTAAVNFEIKNITLVDVDKVALINPLGEGCLDATVNYALDKFESQDTENENGGYWFAFSDTSSTADDTANGKSEATLVDDGSLGAGMALQAKLEKNVTGSAIGTYHKYAGWATLGTGFNGAASADLTGATAIGFKVAKGPDFSDKIMLNFKVANKNVKVDRPHMVRIPAAQMDGSEICVRIAGENIDVKQASWVTPKDELDLSAIKDLSWELKIEDQASAAIHSAEGTIIVSDVVIYSLDDVKLNPDGTDAIRSIAARKFVNAAYAAGVLTVSGLDKYSTLDVVAINGAKVGSLKLNGHAGQQKLGLDLQPGAYFLVARGEGVAKLTQSLAVVR